MQPCKRIEIVVERTQSRQVAAALDALQAGGFTILYGAGGSGDRGPRRADDVTDTDENCVFIVAVDGEEEAKQIVEAVRPVLRRYGGLCLVSDAMRVIH